MVEGFRAYWLEFGGSGSKGSCGFGGLMFGVWGMSGVFGVFGVSNFGACRVRADKRG